MKYISLTGHIAGMNHAVNRYLSRYDIQLQQARHNLMEPFTTLNPYAQTLRKAEKLTELVGMPPAVFVPVSAAEAVNLAEAAWAAYELRDISLRETEEKLAQLKRDAEILSNYSALDIDLSSLREFVYYCMGRLTVENFKKFEKFLHGDKRILFTSAKRDREYVYGIFFTPTVHKDEMNAVLASLDISLVSSYEFTGTPAAAVHNMRVDIIEMQRRVSLLTNASFSDICTVGQLAIACAKVKDLYAAFDIKKYAAISKGRRVFTFSGWISAENASRLEEETESDDLIIFTCHTNKDKPPIILENLPIIRQFEFFTRLYGLPEYDEIDPTPILAITYTLLFGLMFGDIGHGAALAFIGIYVQRRFHGNLGGIMTVVGISAALFGILYGSVFGFEFNPIWRRPTTNISETLVFAAILGAGLIALSMFINMYNCIRRGKIAALLFGANGIAGFTFYSAALWLGIRVLVQGLPVTFPVVIVLILPLVLICFKLPFENYSAGHGLIPKGFVWDTAIELFETLLSYATNTVSFVRVGAFAVSHVGMMHVVLQLSQGAAVTRNIVILVLGNVLVMLIEGLLVGIQVLRLDFYELFSRFYKGTGKEFIVTRKGF
jgi:V/A-type H+-transporting ATPase subunit I